MERESLDQLAQHFRDCELGDPMEVGDYMEWLQREVLPHEVDLRSPMMMGHMTNSLPDYMPQLSEWITSLNLNLVKTETARCASFVERQVLGLLHREVFRRGEAFYAEHMQRRGSCLGVMTCGGTTANIQALWMARRRVFPEAERSGLAGARAVVLVSELGHYSLRKAVMLLGLGSEALVAVPCDGAFRVDLGKMEVELERCRKEDVQVLAVVGLCGATETGSVDDLSALAALCRRYGCHFHVDGAWGGALTFMQRVPGLEEADTVALDAHKLLYTPMGCGSLLIKDPLDPSRVQQAAQYIIREDSWDQGRYTLEGSRPAHAFYLHMNLRCLSRAGLARRLRRSLELARGFAAKLRAAKGFELVTDPPETNIVLYRCVPQSWSEDLAESTEAMDQLQMALQATCGTELEGFVSRTRVRTARYGPLICLRAVFGNLAVTEEAMEKLLAEQRAWADDWGKRCQQEETSSTRTTSAGSE